MRTETTATEGRDTPGREKDGIVLVHVYRRVTCKSYVCAHRFSYHHLCRVRIVENPVIYLTHVVLHGIVMVALLHVFVQNRRCRLIAWLSILKKRMTLRGYIVFSDAVKTSVISNALIFVITRIYKIISAERTRFPDRYT